MGWQWQSPYWEHPDLSCVAGDVVDRVPPLVTPGGWVGAWPALVSRRHPEAGITIPSPLNQPNVNATQCHALVCCSDWPPCAVAVLD